ncbi:MAG: rhodanese-like domain-containing protein [Ignavibacteriales bacterium]|nr:rhodanese-like domain-containing protein [Ignavibacteriales bacterium]
MKKFFSELSTNKKLAIFGFMLGLFALTAGNPYGGTSIKVNEKELALSTVGNSDKVLVTDLADWIIKAKADYELVDLRSEEKYSEYTIPNSQCIPIAQLPQSELFRNQKIVLFSDDNIDAAKAWFILKSKGYKGVYILDGGLDVWKEKVLFPKTPINGSEKEIAQFEKMKEVATYFGGQAQTDSSSTEIKQQISLPTTNLNSTQVTVPKGKKKKREGC